MLMVRAIESCNKEMRVDASFWRREQVGEKGGFVLKMVVEGIGSAAGMIAGYRYTIEARGARIGYLKEEKGSIAAGRVECSEDSIIGEKHFDCTRV